MALGTGTRLGAYEILSPIGSGGMGEVYRARDGKLGRDVAIKVLPPAFILDPDRRARFEREARLLAALNHPHIAAIYGIEETPAIHALVLELVEGETLAERLRGGPLPIAEARRIAAQIADALDAAHEKGIVHRDLKPANIIYTATGAVKLIDFGLGTIVSGDSGGDLSRSPTMTVGGTVEGTLLGTAAYMSPEQARGRPVDKRTDIWAFGCVLYEMLTGRSALAGETVSDTLAAILGREPDWAALPRATPPALARLLRRCLAKDVRERLRDIGDARADLTEATDAGTPTESTPRRVRWLASAAIVASVAALLAVVIWRVFGVAPRPAPLGSGPLTQLTWDSGFTTQPSISADGRLIAYASDRGGNGDLDIWVQQTAGGPPIRLTNDPTDETDPDVSADGSSVAFRSDRAGGGIYIASAFGGDARLIAPLGRAPKFSPDGRSLAYWTGAWLAPRALTAVRQTFVVPTSGGAPTQVATTLAHSGDPVWSPDGRALLVFAHLTLDGSDPRTDWWWVPLDGRPPIQSGAFERLRAAGIMTTPNTFPHPGSWTAQGVLFSAETRNSDGAHLWSVAIDERTGKVTEAPRQIFSGPSREGSPAAAHGGRVVFAGETMHGVILGVPLDANAGRATGAPRPLRNDVAVTSRASVSLDGRLLAFPVLAFGGGEIWLKELSSGRERQLSLTTSRGSPNPVISPDGKWVGYTATTVELGAASGPGAGYVIDAAGGAPKKVCELCEVFGWVADDRRVIVRPGSRTQIEVVDIESGQRTTALSSDGVIDRPIVAPNERWIAFNAKGRVFLAPFTPGQAPPDRSWIQIITVAADERTCGWSPDGRLLYLLLQRDGFRCLYAIRIDEASGRPVGEPFPVYHFHRASLQWGSTGFGSAVVNGLFVADLFEFAGNIWMTSVGHD